MMMPPRERDIISLAALPSALLLARSTIGAVRLKKEAAVKRVDIFQAVWSFCYHDAMTPFVSRYFQEAF